MKHFYVIVNDNKSTIKNQRTWKKAEEILQEKQISYNVYKTTHHGHAEQLAAEILQATTEETYIIVVGGDGTIHEVVNGAAPYSHARIGCIPAGSGNDYARGIQQSKTLYDAIELIEKVIETTAIDLGEFEFNHTRRLFVNSIGMGIDARIAQGVNESKWKRTFQSLNIGKFIYIYFILRELFLFKPFKLKVTADGVEQIFEKAWLVVVTNQPYFGGGLKVSPHSSPLDGKLHMIIVHKIPRILFLFVFITVFWGGHLNLRKWVEEIVCYNVSFSTNIALPIQADGEVVAAQQTSIKLKRKTIQILKY